MTGIRHRFEWIMVNNVITLLKWNTIRRLIGKKHRTSEVVMRMRRPPKPSPSETDALLSVYRASPSRENAARVIEVCEPMIRMAASRISRNNPDLYEDLHQVGR